MIAEYTGKLEQSDEYSNGDNSIFIELVYAAKNRDNNYSLPIEYKELILKSNHYLKPSLIILYIENLKLFFPDIDTKDLILDIFSYEDIYLIGFNLQNSSH
jgi:hypothetical protein